MLSPGFTTIMPWLRISEETLPTFSIGESIQIGEVELYQVLISVTKHAVFFSP
jgi:hypothetical protein